MLAISIAFYWVVRGIILPYLPPQAAEILLYTHRWALKSFSVLAGISAFVGLFGLIGILWYETGKEE